jgi:hypothetical protein
MKFDGKAVVDVIAEKDAEIHRLHTDFNTVKKWQDEHVGQLCEIGSYVGNPEDKDGAVDFDAIVGGVKRLKIEVEEARAALSKIDAIRNDIISTQTVNWIRHIYPLVAALHEVGLDYSDTSAPPGIVLLDGAASPKKRKAKRPKQFDGGTFCFAQASLGGRIYRVVETDSQGFDDPKYTREFLVWLQRALAWQREGGR